MHCLAHLILNTHMSNLSCLHRYFVFCFSYLLTWTMLGLFRDRSSFRYIYLTVLTVFFVPYFLVSVFTHVKGNKKKKDKCTCVTLIETNWKCTLVYLICSTYGTFLSKCTLGILITGEKNTSLELKTSL